MERLQHLANVSVGRACGFAGFGILVAMMGLSYDPRLAASVGASLTMILSFVLVLKGLRAPHDDYRQTELWLMLQGEETPPESLAQAWSTAVRQRAYYGAARYTSAAAACLWVIALVLGALGVDFQPDFMQRPT